MPAADSRCTVRMDRSILSHDVVTCGGSPEVNSTAFDAQPPDLPPVCLVDTGFAVLCQFAPHRRPHHPVLVHRLAPLIHASFRPRLATTPLRFSSPSPPPGWAGDFHPQAVEHVRHSKEKPRIYRGFDRIIELFLSLARLAPIPHRRRRERKPVAAKLAERAKSRHRDHKTENMNQEPGRKSTPIVLCNT